MPIRDTTPLPAFTTTPEQSAILDAYTQTTTNLVITAGAGAGKTSTLRLLAHATPRTRILYLAYNKSIQTDAENTFPRNVTARTAHALAYAAIGRWYRHRLNAPRLSHRDTAAVLRLDDHPLTHPDTGAITHWLTATQVAALVTRTIEAYCRSADPTITTRHVPPPRGLTLTEQTQAARHVARIAAAAWSGEIEPVAGRLRFTHDCYLKLWALSSPRIPYQVILFDEAQDADPCIAGIIDAQTARIVRVGDSAQAIYGWRGATDALAAARGTRLPLTKSFRFGPAVAEQANAWLDVLDADHRIVGHDPVPSRIVDTMPDPDVILCRTNAGVLAAVADQIGAGRTVAVVGGGSELRSFAEAAAALQAGRGTSHPDLFAFRSWTEVLEYVAGDDGADLRTMVRLVDSTGPARVLEMLDRCVAESVADVAVSTAHKAKGREWDRVLVWGDFPQVEDGEEPDREDVMLAYVTVTRARLELCRGSLAFIDCLEAPTKTPHAPAVAAVERRDHPSEWFRMLDTPEGFCAGCGRAPCGGCGPDRFRPPPPAPTPCASAPLCDGTGQRLECMLCPTSPTYWRAPTVTTGPNPN